MAGTSLDRVLSCPNLPSLPGAAVAILEQTRDPNVTLEQIAGTIQTDPALATKVLRTVNSSYYGLSQPCSTISRALGFLGLQAVKSVVLGFSLVDSAKRSTAGGGFDLAAYWRRAVYAAAGARLVAEAAGDLDRDEAFLAALVQDIGMLASFAALNEEYAALLAEAGPDHDGLATAEQNALGFTHVEAGAQLAQKWRLPDQIVACIRHHHEPENAAPAHRALARAVALGGLLAGILTLSDRAEKIRLAGESAARWFSIKSDEALALVEKTAERGGELARALEVKTGEAPDIAQIMGQASEALLAHQVAMVRESDTLRRTTQELARQNLTDDLTGAHNRKHFDAALARAFVGARSDGHPLALLFCDADRFKSVNDAHGHKAGDAVLVELSKRLRRVVGEAGTVCRYGGEEFVALLPGSGAAAARDLAERIRLAVTSPAFDIRGAGGKAGSVSVTISVGISALEAGAGFSEPEQLLQAADAAAYAAKRAGRNRVCVAGDAAVLQAAPATGAQAASGTVVMLVDRDPLASHLIEVLLTQRRGAKVVQAGSAEEALRLLDGPTGKVRPQLIITDLDLPGMSGEGLIRAIRQRQGLGSVPVVVLTASTRPQIRELSLGAGAKAFITKAEMARDMDGWIGRLAAFCAPPPAKAAAA